MKELLPILKELSEFVEFEELAPDFNNPTIYTKEENEAEWVSANIKFFKLSNPCAVWFIPTVEWFEDKIIEYIDKLFKDAGVESKWELLWRRLNDSHQYSVITIYRSHNNTTEHPNRLIAVASLLLKLFKENKES